MSGCTQQSTCALAVERRTHKQTNTQADRGDYNTLRSLARSVMTKTRGFIKLLVLGHTMPGGSICCGVTSGVSS